MKLRNTELWRASGNSNQELLISRILYFHFSEVNNYSPKLDNEIMNHNNIIFIIHLLEFSHIVVLQHLWTMVSRNNVQQQTLKNKQVNINLKKKKKKNMRL